MLATFTSTLACVYLSRTVPNVSSVQEASKPGTRLRATSLFLISPKAHPHFECKARGCQYWACQKLARNVPLPFHSPEMPIDSRSGIRFHNPHIEGFESFSHKSRHSHTRAEGLRPSFRSCTTIWMSS